MANYKQFDCETAYQQIMERLGGRNIPEDYKQGLTNLREAGSDFVVHMGTIDVSDISEDVIKQVIGKGGCYFILTTTEQDLDFIWHNTKTKVFEFWGPEDNINYGINQINYRINKIRNEMNMEKEYDEYDGAD